MNPEDPPRKKSVDDLALRNLRPFPLSDEDKEEFARGVRLFNERKFWEAHEAWEVVWRRHTEDGRLFLQGLILMAAAYHTLFDKGRYMGSLSNLAKALYRLELFEPEFLGVSVMPLMEKMRGCRQEVKWLGPEGVARIKKLWIPKIDWDPNE